MRVRAWMRPGASSRSCCACMTDRPARASSPRGVSSRTTQRRSSGSPIRRMRPAAGALAELDNGVVAEAERLGDVGDGDVGALGSSCDLHQELMLLRFEPGGHGGLLTELQEVADGGTELSEEADFAKVEGSGRRCNHRYIVSRCNFALVAGGAMCEEVHRGFLSAFLVRTAVDRHGDCDCDDAASPASASARQDHASAALSRTAAARGLARIGLHSIQGMH